MTDRIHWESQYAAQNLARNAAAAIEVLYEMRDAIPGSTTEQCYAVGVAKCYLEDALRKHRLDIAEQCAPWFAPQATGRYSVMCVDASGSMWTEMRGFHYPMAAQAAGERMMRLRPPFTYACNFMWWVHDDENPERCSIDPEDWDDE